ncbi:MAG: helix-turn-helix domain-containing protein [Gemmatimonadaceae bacterium]
MMTPSSFWRYSRRKIDKPRGPSWILAEQGSRVTTRCRSPTICGVIMDAAKKRRLKEAGWSTGSVAEFLDLTPEESALIEIKLRLSQLVKKARIRRHLSQTALAEKLGSSQSRVAKIESGDPSVSLDLLVRATFALGATRKEMARAIA